MRESWPEVPLKDILKRIERPESIRPEKEYRQAGVKLWGEGAYERESILGASTRYATLFRIDSNDVIINKIWVRNGSTAVVQPGLTGCYVSGEFPTFTINAERLHPRWMHWLTKMPSFWRLCDQRSQGTSGKNRIKPEEFLDIGIPLPPMEEQLRLVKRIEEVSTKIAEAHSVCQELIEETKEVYARTLSSLMSQPNESGWTFKTVGYVIESMDAGWSPACENAPASGDEYGILRTTSIQWGAFIPGENKKLPDGYLARPELSVRNGDILVTRAGPRKRVGVVATATEDHKNLMISDKIIRLRARSGIIDHQFLGMCLTSPLSQDYLVQRKTGLADAQVNISQDILRNTPIAYPSIADQKKIVIALETMKKKLDTLLKAQFEMMTDLDALLPSFLDTALNGRI